MTLTQILELVGTLDDQPGDNTASARFRAYLAKSVTTVGALRDYIETCLRASGDQYDRALQDLVNHVARLMGFTVEFGRYRGAQRQIGHDGLWMSKDGYYIVPEIKTTDAYAIRTATLIGYIDNLISEKRISDWDHALGLYFVGRVDAGLSQLTSAIVAEKRLHQLRVASIETLLSLAELMERFDVTHEEVLAVLRPGGPLLDDLVKLFARVASLGGASGDAEEPEEPKASAAPERTASSSGPTSRDSKLCLLTSVADEPDSPAEEVIRSLLDQGVYVFGERTPGRKDLKPGDQVCFYQSGMGVVAEATVAGYPEKKKVKFVRDPDRFPWAFRVTDVRYFFDKPVVIDASLRSLLDAFKGRDPNKAWAWFVQATRRVSTHDFEVLVGRV